MTFDNELFTSGSTDFNIGDVVHGGTYTNFFMITNEAVSGDLVMAATDPITITGPDASRFSILADSSGYAIAPGESIGFDLNFLANSSSINTATISIFTNDADESPFTFTVNANVVDQAPDCSVSSGDMEMTYVGSVPVIDIFGDQSLQGIESYESPAGWSPFISLAFSLFGFDINVRSSEDSYSGSSAIEIGYDGSGFGDLLTRIYCTDQPDLLSGHYKYNGAATDTALIIVSSGGLASQTDANTDTLLFTSDAASYTGFSIDIPYDGSSNDSILIHLITTAS